MLFFKQEVSNLKKSRNFPDCQIRWVNTAQPQVNDNSIYKREMFLFTVSIIIAANLKYQISGTMGGVGIRDRGTNFGTKGKIQEYKEKIPCHEVHHIKIN